MDTKRKIEIGKVYSAKVGGSWLPVRIEKSLGHGRYESAALPSGKTVKISTDAIKGDGQTPEQWQAKRTPKEHNPPTPAPAAKDEQPKTAVKTMLKKERKIGGLDAAVLVLREAGTPMRIGDIVRTAIEKGYWSSGGKTPHATVSAAVGREIATKGTASRFRKVDRSRFELVK